MEAELVKSAFEVFLRTHVPQACLSNVDDVVLSYIADVLCGLSEDETSFDAEQFSEMIAAYIPEFTTVECSEVCEWVFGLVDKQRHANEERGNVVEPCSSSETSSTLKLSDSQQNYVDVASIKTRIPSLQKETSGNTQPQGTKAHPHPKKTDKFAEKRTVKEKYNKEREITLQEDSSPSEDIVLLREMFPDMGEERLRNTLKRCGSDMDSTVQRLLTMADQEREKEREREWEREKVKSKEMLQQREKDFADKDLKELVLARYAYVDTDEDKATHRPVLSKAEPKKMVRYRDNRVVSTKGERYTVLTRKDTEGEEMKKTYVNLKPLRKYRFH